MKRQSVIGLALLTLGLGGSCLAAENPRTVAIHAGQMFDSKSERMASKQVIVIQGERIADVGLEGSVKIPLGAEEIDLGTATVLPGLVESHNHMFKVGNYPGSGADAVVPAEIRPGNDGRRGKRHCRRGAPAGCQDRLHGPCRNRGAAVDRGGL